MSNDKELILDATLINAGQYECIANNGVDDVLRKLINIHISGKKKMNLLLYDLKFIGSEKNVARIFLFSFKLNCILN